MRIEDVNGEEKVSFARLIPVGGSVDSPEERTLSNSAARTLLNIIYGNLHLADETLYTELLRITEREYISEESEDLKHFSKGVYDNIARLIYEGFKKYKEKYDKL